MSGSSANGTRGSEGQTFLVGPTLYLRGVEPGDAGQTPAWYPSPFPLPATVAEERIGKEIPEQAQRQVYRLVACRIADDRPAGSVLIEIPEWRVGWVHLHANPAVGGAGEGVKAELLGLVVPWLVRERDLMAVWVVTERGESPVEAAAAALGMRQAYRLREAIQRNGTRRDEVLYEALHPEWVARLGMPAAAVDGAVEREVRHPAPAHAPAPIGDPPCNAIVVGERLYLRPIEAEDAERAARWSRQETETFFDQGRPVRGPLDDAALHKKLAAEDPPTWIRFAIVLREGDELIGANGITEIDWVQRTAETESELYRPEHRGGGLGTEAKHLLLAYAFDRLGLHMVRSFVWEPNTRSAAALRKQGYRAAGYLAWTGIKNGGFTGEFVFDLLAAEWRAARR